MTTEERADYLMEAFLDEQNTLIRPLVSRKLHLVKVLDERSFIVERILEDKRKKLLHGGGTARKGPTGGSVLEIETLEDELEQLSLEKVTILNQLMDIVKRPYDTILEVESALRAASDSLVTALDVRSKKSNTAPTTITNSVDIVEEPQELWCYCRKPDDGRPMVACDNGKCDIVWWHIDCVDKYVANNHVGVAPPDDSRKWDCPVCIAQEIVKREQHPPPRRVTTKRR
jgi:hypothetical protein